MSDADFDALVARPEGIERTAALVAWFQGLFADAGEIPVLVGGAAVELLSGGSYVTGNFDFVGEIPDRVATSLRAVGFVRRGRHFVHEAAQVFVELPGSALGVGERRAIYEVAGFRIEGVSVEDLVVDRLAAWQQRGSRIDGAAAAQVLARVRQGFDDEHFLAQARRGGVDGPAGRLLAFVRSRGGEGPGDEEIERWVRRESRSRSR